MCAGVLGGWRLLWGGAGGGVVEGADVGERVRLQQLQWGECWLEVERCLSFNTPRRPFATAPPLARGLIVIHSSPAPALSSTGVTRFNVFPICSNAIIMNTVQNSSARSVF